jgi:single-strand DNA-binding protein
MSDRLTLTGLVATTPRHIVTPEGLASQQRKYDRQSNSWADGETIWSAVTAFRNLAVNASQSLNKGDRIVAAGRVKVRDWTTEDRTGTSIEVESDALGYDLFWGTSQYKKVARRRADEESGPDHETL